MFTVRVKTGRGRRQNAGKRDAEIEMWTTAGFSWSWRKMETSACSMDTRGLWLVIHLQSLDDVCAARSVVKDTS